MQHTFAGTVDSMQAPSPNVSKSAQVNGCKSKSNAQHKKPQCFYTFNGVDSFEYTSSRDFSGSDWYFFVQIVLWFLPLVFVLHFKKFLFASCFAIEIHRILFTFEKEKCFMSFILLFCFIFFDFKFSCRLLSSKSVRYYAGQFIRQSYGNFVRHLEIIAL